MSTHSAARLLSQLTTLGLCALLSVVVIVAPGWAQVPHDRGVQLNSWTTDDQDDVDVARGVDGGFLVVWDSATSAGTDSLGSSIRGRFFDSAGAPQGDDFQINTYTTHDQQNPAVAAAPNGDFMVVWQSGDASDYFTDRTISGQRYASDGTTVAGELQVRQVTDTTLEIPTVVRHPDVAFNSNGDFLVVWEYQTTIDIVLPDDFHRIEGRGYDASGNPLSDTTLFAAATCDHLEPCNRVTQPAVVDGPTGDFAVVWNEDTYEDNIQEYRLRLQRYAADATANGDLFRVSTFNSARLSRPQIARNGSDMLVVWESADVGDTDSSGTSIRARMAGPDGSPLGDEFQVNVLPGDNQRAPAVSTDISPFADFAIAWQDSEVDAADILLRRIGRDGHPLANVERLSDTVNDLTSQQEPALAPGFAAWHSATSHGDDNGSDSVQGSLLSAPLDLELRGWWRGDGNANDSSDNGNDGTTNAGVSYGEGPFALAFDLDGINGNVNVPHDVSLDVGTDSFSVSFWLQTSSIEAGIVSKETVPLTTGFTIYLDDGFPAFRVSSLDGDTQQVCNQQVVNDGAVHFVAMSFQRHQVAGTSGLEATTYVDGVALCNPFDALNTASSDNSTSLRLGADLDHGDLAGILESVRFYGRVIGPGEVESLYRTFSGLLFENGFESGDTAAWSAATP